MGKEEGIRDKCGERVDVMVNCACKDKLCPIKILFDENRLHFIDKNGEETIMYLDANAIVELKNKLNEILTNM